MNARLILGIAALAATSLVIGQDGLINKGRESASKRSSPSQSRQSGGTRNAPSVRGVPDGGNRQRTPRTDTSRQPTPSLGRNPAPRLETGRPTQQRERPSITFGRGDGQSQNDVRRDDRDRPSLNRANGQRERPSVTFGRGGGQSQNDARRDDRSRPGLNRPNDRNSQLGFPTHDGGKQTAPRNDRENRNNAPSFTFGQDGLLGKGKGSGSGGSGGSSGSGGSVGGNRGSQNQERQDRNGRLGFPDHGGGKGQDNNLSKRPAARTGGNGFKGQGFTIVNERTKLGPVSIDPLPRDYLSRDLRDQVRHTERIGNHGWRSGYYVDNWRWGDRGFIYPFYESSYYHERCVTSPWYYYSCLPGYVLSVRVRFGNWTLIACNDRYDWGRRDRYDRYDRYDRELDNAIEDIQDAWENRDARALERLIPRRGNVNILLDGYFRYSINSDDYYDMMADAIWTSPTHRYEIYDVYTGRNHARVVACHTYYDAWGRSNSVFHTYVLEEGRRGYEIIEFGTSRGRP
ncbi:MAG: hypothetical protein HONBIEJF_00296 [Fimbriimonadaceae bacterium]|nr:hypothetical protein [Fimbriimonadaceae bacterium]